MTHRLYSLLTIYRNCCVSEPKKGQITAFPPALDPLLIIHQSYQEVMMCIRSIQTCITSFKATATSKQGGVIRSQQSDCQMRNSQKQFHLELLELQNPVKTKNPSIRCRMQHSSAADSFILFACKQEKKKQKLKNNMFYTVRYTPTNTNNCTRLIRDNYSPQLQREKQATVSASSKMHLRTIKPSPLKL